MTEKEVANVEFLKDLSQLFAKHNIDGAVQMCYSWNGDLYNVMQQGAKNPDHDVIVFSVQQVVGALIRSEGRYDSFRQR